MIDPALGRVPYERLAQERERIMSQSKNGRLGAQSAIPGMTWQERGPSNAGGRTRAVLFDPNDPTHKKVWLGSPSGGLWYTNDITDANATWTPVSDSWESMIVTCLAADPSNPQVMYAGTGDSYRNLIGGGIWKTTDGGTTWSRLSNTIPGTFYGTLAASFGYIQRIVVTSTGQVFAANRYGVVRSADGGITWQYALAPTQAIGISGPSSNNYFQDFVSDLEAGTDGIVYAAFNPSRVFRANSTTGVAWTEITPTGVTTGGERTELALAPSTSGVGQVLYAVSRAYNSVNYGQDIKWFRKTTDAGTTWTNVTIPSYSWGDHFTSGQGYTAMSLISDPQNANIVYAGGYNWFRSVDGGSSWTASSTTTSYSSYHGLALQPGNLANAVLIAENGVKWTTGWGDRTTSTMPTQLSRNAGYRIADVTSAAVRSIPGSAYILSTSNGFGPSTISNSGLSVGNSLYSSTDYKGRTFIDENEPALQIYSDYSSWNRYLATTNSSAYLFGQSGSLDTNPAAYDSQNNIFYTGSYANGFYIVSRFTGITSTVVSSTFAIATYPYCLKLGMNSASLFVGHSDGTIYKYTNLSQAIPTGVRIASNNSLPPNSVVSCIDVGASDNELLVTLSNFGISSVWYTSNGGATWVNKDPAESGLPDVPVRVGMFNSQNRQQVLLGTDLGIWTTNDITAANPGWSSGNTGFPLIRVNQLRYRASDGQLIAATAGRGIYETNALAIPYTPSSISITSVSTTTLCAGGTLDVAFTTAGPLATMTTNYEVWISTVNGSSVIQQKLGTSTGSPIRVTLPTGYNSLPYSTTYKVRVIAADFDVYSPDSQSLAIGNLRSVEIVSRDEPANSWTSGTTVCPNEQFRLYARVLTTDFGQTQSAESYTWFRNGTKIATTTSFSVLAQGVGNFEVTVRQAGCVILATDYYSVNESNSPNPSIRTPIDGILPQCTDKPFKLTSRYIGETVRLQWLRDGVAIAGATSYTYDASVTGGYSISITNEQSCNSASAQQQLQFGNSLYINLRLSPEYDSVLCAG
ncbi:MAG: hypothetical protein EOO39_04750, partial [Cytophagaceae bacterium]